MWVASIWPLYDRRGPTREKETEEESTGFLASGQLTYFFNGVFFILKRHTVCLVHGGFDSVLLAEQVEELGGAELVPPLVRSRAEAQTQGKDEMLQDTDEGRGRAVTVYPHAQHHPPFPLQWAPHLVVHYAWESPLYR